MQSVSYEMQTAAGREESADFAAVRHENRKMGGAERESLVIGSDPEGLRGRQAARVEWVQALGHVLLCCPPVVMAWVNHWMSWRIFNHESDKADTAEEALERLLFTVLNDGIDLQVKLRRVEDRRRAATRISYEISTMYNTESHRLSDFACSETVLTAAVKELESPVHEIRLWTTIMYIMSNVHVKLFSHVEDSTDRNSAHYRNFIDNDMIERLQDHSAFFVAIGIHIGCCVEAAIKEKSDGADQVRANASLDAANTLMRVYEDQIVHIRARCSRIANKRAELPEALCRYLPRDEEDGDEEEDCYFSGVPIEVAQREDYTLLWMQWVWQEQIEAKGVPVMSVLRDLWRAKSAFLFDVYNDFFEGERNFDEKIMQIARSLVDAGQ